MTPTQAADVTLSGIAFDSIDNFSDGDLKDFNEIDQSALLTLDTLRRLVDEESSEDSDDSNDEPDGSKYLAEAMADGGDNETRAERALKDIVAIEELGPGMCRVVSWSDAHDVDMRRGGCNCPDKQYNIDGGMHCKHEHAAMLYSRNDVPGVSMDDDLGGQTLVADGGLVVENGDHPADKFKIVDHDNDNVQMADSKRDAEDMADTARDLGSSDVEVLAPASDDDPDPEIVDHSPDADDASDATHDPEVIDADEAAEVLPDRDVSEDPLKWLPGEFVDTIDGSPAINRKGFEVLSHFYNVEVQSNLEVPPEETDHEYCRFKATAEIDGRTVEAHGSAHVDRGDDHTLLLEMADTRARKRALSIATGAGAVAVSELKNKPEGQR